MKKIKENGLLLYSIFIIIVTITEFALQYRPGFRNIVLHTLMLVKIPLAYLAISNLKVLCEKADFRKSILFFEMLTVTYVLDYIINIFCSFNFYAAENNLLEMDMKIFFGLLVLEFIFEYFAFSKLLLKTDLEGLVVIWAGINICILLGGLEEYFNFLSSGILNGVYSEGLAEIIMLLLVLIRIILPICIGVRFKKHIKIEKCAESA